MKWLIVQPDALASAGVKFLVRYRYPQRRTLADRAVVALDRDGAASAVIAPIISVGAITASIVVAIVMRLRAHSHAADRCINGNLS